MNIKNNIRIFTLSVFIFISFIFGYFLSPDKLFAQTPPVNQILCINCSTSQIACDAYYNVPVKCEGNPTDCCRIDRPQCNFGDLWYINCIPEHCPAGESCFTYNTPDLCQQAGGDPRACSNLNHNYTGNCCIQSSVSPTPGPTNPWGECQFTPNYCDEQSDCYDPSKPVCDFNQNPFIDWCYGTCIPGPECPSGYNCSWVLTPDLCDAQGGISTSCQRATGLGNCCVPQPPDCGAEGQMCCANKNCFSPLECVNIGNVVEEDWRCADRSKDCSCEGPSNVGVCFIRPEYPCPTGYIGYPKCIFDPFAQPQCQGDMCYCLPTSPTPSVGFPTAAYLECGQYCDQNSDFRYGSCLDFKPLDIECIRPPDPTYAYKDCSIGGNLYDCWCCKEYMEPVTFRESLDPLCGGASIRTAIGCIPVGDRNQFLAFILRWAIGIAGGVSFLLIVYSGFTLITSGGDKRKLQVGRELLTAALSGLLLIVFSVFILDFIGIRILKIPGLI